MLGLVSDGDTPPTVLLPVSTTCVLLRYPFASLEKSEYVLVHLATTFNPYAHVNAAIATPIAAATTTVPMLLPLPALVAPLIWKGSVPLACMTPRTNGEGIRYSSCQN